MQLPPKVCPECGEEYVHAASMCVHCDVALQLPSEGAGAEPEGLPPASELTLVRAASVSWVRGFSLRLAEAGIPHRVELFDAAGDTRARAQAGTCGVYVRPADAEEALRIDAAHLRSEIPDLPDEVGPAEAGADGCPACGEAIGPDASECGSCGLPFLDVE
jgi:hypothetical protein